MDETSSESQPQQDAAVTGVTSGHAVPVLVWDKDGGFQLNEDKLVEILRRPNILDKPVVVVSVAGAFRKGKSFLLNFFIRYLRNGGRGDWLGSAGTPLEGFSWRGGFERHTTGILLWDEVFLVTMPDETQVAVLLMDTQGTFDTFTTVKECATIFALSLMTSSVQVYNLSQNIQENDLQNFQYFTEYGRMAQEQGNSEKPFQKLVFLVRDWPNALSNPYGADGGTKFLNTRLNTSQPGSEQETLRNRIRSSFSELCCFLMPYPGIKVATGQSTGGCLPEMEGEFRHQLQQFVAWLLAEDKLVTKTINGQEASCNDWLIYFTTCAKSLQKEGLPRPKSILEATADANNMVAQSKAQKRYDDGMQRVCDGDQPFRNSWSLQEHHEHHLEAALKLFARFPKLGGEEYSSPYEAKLKDELQEAFKKLVAENNTKSCNATAVVLSVPAVVSAGGAAAAMAVLSGPVGVVVVGAAVLMAGTTAGTLLTWGFSRATGKLATFRQALDNVVDYSWKKMTGAKERVEDFDPPLASDSKSRKKCSARKPEEGKTASTSVERATDASSFDSDAEKTRGCIPRTGPVTKSTLEEPDQTYENSAVRNDRRNVFAAARTPTALCAVGLFFYALSCTLAFVGLHTFAGVCDLLFGISLLSLVLWFFAQYTGHMREVVVEIDNFADIIYARVLEPLCQNVMRSTS